MELPIHEAKTRLSELVEIVKSGERVVILENGEPVAELVCRQGRGGIDFEKLESVRKHLGVSGNRERWPEECNDSKFSRQVLGLDEGD